MNPFSKLLSILKNPGRLSVWRGKVWAQKKLILLQERYGWYPYARWRQRWARQAERDSARRPDAESARGTKFSIFLDAAGPCSMLQCLQSGTWSAWEAQAAALSKDRALLSPAGDRGVFQEPVEASAAGYGLSGSPEEWNDLLRSVDGDWLGFWGQEDAIEPGLLKSAAGCIAAAPDGDVVYFDEDCVTGGAAPVYHTPFFKPDWSPELLISVNYARRALFRRQALLEGLARLDQGVQLDLDDLTLLGCETARKIIHLPGPFYHVRDSRPNRGTGELPPAWRPASSRAIAAHLERQGVHDPQISTTERGVVHAAWKTRQKLVSIVIPTKDKVEYLERCIRSIREVNDYANYEIVLVDSGSREEATRRYYAGLRDDPKVRIIDYTGTFNYSRANNLGAQHARGDLLLFLNNDVEAVEPHWLQELVQWAERPPIGIVGAKLLYPDGLIQHAGIVMGMEGHASHVFSGMPEGSSGPFGSVEWYRDYLAVTAACMLMRREVFDVIGKFDESYELVFGDVEICVRAVEHGFRVVYNPFARLVHHEGKTRGRQMVSDDIHKAYTRFADRVAAGDPFYNRSLTHAVRMPALRRAWEDNPLQRLERIVRDY